MLVKGKLPHQDLKYFEKMKIFVLEQPKSTDFLSSLGKNIPARHSIQWLEIGLTLSCN